MRHWGATAPIGELRTYKVVFLTAGGARNYPIKWYRVWSAKRTAMMVHFLHRYVKDTVIILEEGNIPHPRCNILMSWKALNGRHVTTAQCA